MPGEDVATVDVSTLNSFVSGRIYADGILGCLNAVMSTARYTPPTGSAARMHPGYDVNLAQLITPAKLRRLLVPIQLFLALQI